MSRIARALTIGLAAVFVAGCAAPPPAGGPATGAPAATAATPTPVAKIRMQDDGPAGTPKSGGRLRMMIRLDATQLDPHKTNETSSYLVNENTYESLLEAVNGEIRPSLAESWTVAPDGLTYTFKLRSNVKFHSGRTFSSADVKYSIERIMDPATASPRRANYAGISAIETPDPSTVVFKLRTPFAPFLALMSTSGASIVDKDVADGAAGLNGAVDGGTGAFQTKERVKGQQIVLDKNPSYWRPGLPYLDGITITFNPDDNARAAAVRSGTVDFLWRAAPEFIEGLKADPNLKWYGGVGSLSLHFVMNTQKKPFDDVRVRQAVFYALDREQILAVANSGLGTVLNAGYLPPDRWGGIKEPIYGKPDIAKAKALLAEAGYPNGLKTTLLVISTSAFQVRSAEAEQQQLKAVGIEVELRPVEATVANPMVAAGNFEIFQSGFSMTLDPDELFSRAFLSTGGNNYGKWKDQEYDDLIIKARSTTDRAERERIYQQAERILATRGPAGMTWASADFDVVQKKVMGYKGDPTPGYRFYRELWIQ